MPRGVEPATNATVPAAQRYTSARVWTAGVAQLAMLFISLIPWLAPSLFAILILESETLSALELVGWVAVAIVATPLIALLLPIAAKWLLLGKVRPGRYPLWGWFFCRWWLVRKLLQTAPIDYIAGSPLLAPYLRLMGARIGRGCHIGTSRVDVPDLLEIGDGASIGYNVELDPSTVANGWLTHRADSNRRERISEPLGGFAWRNGRPGGARVAEQSLVAEGQTIPDHETWAGSPSSAPLPIRSSICSLRKSRCNAGRSACSSVSALGFIMLEVLPLLAVVPGLVLIWGLYDGDIWLGLALTLPRDCCTFWLLAPLS